MVLVWITILFRQIVSAVRRKPKFGGFAYAQATMRTRFLALLTFAIFTGWTAARAADPIAGVVKSVTGTVVIQRGDQSIQVVEGMHLLEKDTVRTAAASRAGLILQDGTRLALDPDTSLTLTRFEYDPGQQKLGLILELLRGTAAYISGKISQLAPKSVEIRTPVGMLGLRGTEVIISLDLP